MKTLYIAALAFTFATPAAAQPAQRADQGHAQHGQHDGHGSHAQHQAPGQHQGHGQHAQHGTGQGQDHSKHANCCADANGNGKMDCCEGAAGAQGSGCAMHQQHGQQRPAPAQPRN